MGKRQLVHGLTEPVELSDWDYALILAALREYKKAVLACDPPLITLAKYVGRIEGKLRPPFLRLVKRTKREHRRLRNLETHKPLLEAGGTP